MISQVGISFALFVVGISATDYCNPALCDPTKVHIGCNNKNIFASTCLNPSLVNMDATLQSLILDTHNNLRNQFAAGLSKFNPAARMPLLKWDPELATLAEYNVRQCQVLHDQCRNTDAFKFAGQNLGSEGTTETLTPELIQTNTKIIIGGWYNENNVATQTWLDTYPAETGGTVIGHFTQVVQDHAAYIGCALSQYQEVQNGFTFNNLLLACDYSYTNMKTFPVYTKGAVGSKCTTGFDTTYKSLCSPAEVIVPAPF